MSKTAAAAAATTDKSTLFDRLQKPPADLVKKSAAVEEPDTDVDASESATAAAPATPTKNSASKKRKARTEDEDKNDEVEASSQKTEKQKKKVPKKTKAQKSEGGGSGDEEGEKKERKVSLMQSTYTDMFKNAFSDYDNVVGKFAMWFDPEYKPDASNSHIQLANKDFVDQKVRLGVVCTPYEYDIDCGMDEFLVAFSSRESVVRRIRTDVKGAWRKAGATDVNVTFMFYETGAIQSVSLYVYK